MEREEKEQKELDSLRRSVIGLIESGQLGRAMNRVTSHGLGDISDPEIRTQLTEKFPPRSRQLPLSVPKTKPIDSFRNIRDNFLTLDPGTAPGAGGLRNEYLYALGERMEDEEIKMMEELGLEYLAETYRVGSIKSGSLCRQLLHTRIRIKKQSGHLDLGTH